MLSSLLTFMGGKMNIIIVKFRPLDQLFQILRGERMSNFLVFPFSNDNDDDREKSLGYMTKYVVRKLMEVSCGCLMKKNYTPATLQHWI